MDLSMQMKALRSLNLAKLSSSSSTRDEYWATSISAGTPAGYCLSQMRSMSLPLSVRFLEFCPVVPGHFIILGNIGRCRRRWQAAAGLGGNGHGNVVAPVQPEKSPSAQLLIGCGFSRWSWTWAQAWLA